MHGPHPPAPTQDQSGALYTKTAGGIAAATSVIDSEFHHCSSAGAGGAYRVHSGQTYMQNVSFFACHSDSDGGGFAQESGESTLVDCHFDGCTATDGGAISMGFGDLTLQRAVIERCEAVSGSFGGGAGVLCSGGVTVINDTRVVDCIIPGTTGGGGGILVRLMLPSPNTPPLLARAF